MLPHWEILVSIHCSAQEAQKIAYQGKQHFEEVAKEVEDLKKQYQLKAEKAECEVKKYEKLADKKEAAAKAAATRSAVNAALSGTTSLVPLSKAGISIVGAAAGAETIASLPVIGAALTTTTATTASVGGFWGSCCLQPSWIDGGNCVRCGVRTLGREVRCRFSLLQWTKT